MKTNNEIEEVYEKIIYTLTVREQIKLISLLAEHIDWFHFLNNEK